MQRGVGAVVQQADVGALLDEEEDEHGVVILRRDQQRRRLLDVNLVDIHTPGEKELDDFDVSLCRCPVQWLHAGRLDGHVDGRTCGDERLQQVHVAEERGPVHGRRAVLCVEFTKCLRELGHEGLGLFDLAQLDRGNQHVDWARLWSLNTLGQRGREWHVRR